jgi:hypothetical protein
MALLQFMQAGKATACRAQHRALRPPHSSQRRRHGRPGRSQHRKPRGIRLPGFGFE